jgi:putative restriction endonuclease
LKQPVPAAENLPVPVPAERVKPDDLSYATRDGQSAFRNIVIAAYGQCAVTGCTEEAALQAAHIIPYVDARSHVIQNGVCLRADIHCLFDRGLISVGEDMRIRIEPGVRSLDYRALDGQLLRMPIRETDRPIAKLFVLRREYLPLRPERLAI